MKLITNLHNKMWKIYKDEQLYLKTISPLNNEYLKLLNIDILFSFFPELSPYKKDILDTNTNNQLVLSKYIEDENIVDKFNTVMKGSWFLFLKEILSWNEVKVLLNIDIDDENEFISLDDSFNVILSLLSIFFNEVYYEPKSNKSEYVFLRSADDKYYSDLPMYYYGIKNKISHGSKEDILSSLEWYINSNTFNPIITKEWIYNKIRINNNPSKDEITDMSLFNVCLNMWEKNGKWVLGNTLFEFYRAYKEDTYINEYDIEIDFEELKDYSKYVDNVILLGEWYPDTDNIEVLNKFDNMQKIRKVLLEIQNFLIN